MAKKEKYVDFIFGELTKGNVKREQVLSKFVKKWQTSSRTFDRYFKIANIDFNKLQSRATEKKEEVYLKEVNPVSNSVSEITICLCKVSNLSLFVFKPFKTLFCSNL